MGSTDIQSLEIFKLDTNRPVKMIRKVAVCGAIALAGAANAYATDRDSAAASASGYGAPAASYGAPEPSYEEPAQEYAAAPPYAESEVPKVPKMRAQCPTWSRGSKTCTWLFFRARSVWRGLPVKLEGSPRMQESASLLPRLQHLSFPRSAAR